MGSLTSLIPVVTILAEVVFGMLVLLAIVGVRYIPHRRVGILEKLWSSSGSLTQGRILALKGEAGYQARVLRGGLYIGYPFWMYRVHAVPLVTIAEGRIGYVYARDGLPLGQSQTLGAIVDCNGFQDPKRSSRSAVVVVSNCKCSPTARSSSTAGLRPSNCSRKRSSRLATSASSFPTTAPAAKT